MEEGNLVLSREVGEEIVIGDNVFIRLYAMRGGKATISIRAPKDVRILRRELWDEMQLAKAKESA